MFRWWQRLQDRERLAEEDATLLIARFGTRASYIASRRLAQMRNGAVFDSNRPACHWKRVHSIVRGLLPYDEDDERPTIGALPTLALGRVHDTHTAHI
jgi:hypothetical protein